MGGSGAAANVRRAYFRLAGAGDLAAHGNQRTLRGLLMIKSDYEIVHSDCSTDHGVWFRCILVCVSNVPLAQHQIEHGRIGQGDRTIQ